MTDDSDICITVEGVDCTILCGQCKTPIRYVAITNGDSSDANPTDAGCGRCDNFAKIEEIASIAIENAGDEGQLALNRAMRDAAKGSSMMSFKGETMNNKIYRFVVEL